MNQPTHTAFAAACLLLAAWTPQPATAAEPLSQFDFTQASVVGQWQAQHHISSLRHTPEGLEVTIAGEDPYFAGPPRDYPPDQPLWVYLRLKSDEGGGAQLFFFRDQSTEQQSVRFNVFPGGWRDIRLRLPSLGRGYRFRLDPPGTGGKMVLAYLRVAAATVLQPPAWPKPGSPKLDAQQPRLEAGALSLAQGAELGEFALRVKGKATAIGHSRPFLGYLKDEQLRWLSLNENARRKTQVTRDTNMISVTSEFTDADSAKWVVSQVFKRATNADAINVETRVEVDRERSVIYLPLLTLLPGAGSFGTNKNQGLLAGVEYLSNEPSSSEADLRGPASKRLVPDTLKLTFPLMAIQVEDRYVGLVWEMQPQISALFDSPDRTFGSGGHALALLFPGSDGANREDGQLLPHDGTVLAPKQPLVLRATLIGGSGRSTAPAIQKYVQLRGLPPMPQTMPLEAYVPLAASGWLDSKAREGNKYRHAVWGGFGAQPAADAALYMDWLAGRTRNTNLVRRLNSAARDALAQVTPAQYYSSAISHVRFPAVPLVYGQVMENTRQAAKIGRGLLGRFEPDGGILYRKPPQGEDYGKTHFAPHANGLTAQVVASLLEAAAFSGEAELIEEALKKLRALDRYRNDVPRGAQTWEVPLHTPDILASAHLVHAYTLGYELTGDTNLLQSARYWAWTGVPFVYLVEPTDKPIGRYTTPPVFGATGWVAPVWIGLPVQWCGLVYADALYRFARHEGRGPWKRLADGISAAGVQVTWPSSDKERPGLLPDVFHLRDQFRDGPAINPGTVQACATRWYGQGPLYDFRTVRPNGWLIHAPGAISGTTNVAAGVQFSVTGWPRKPYYVLVNGLKQLPQVRVNDQPVELKAPHEFADGKLVLQVRGKARIEITAAP